MDNITSELIRQCPTLVVLAWLVWMFLKHLSQRDQMLKDLGHDCHEVQRDAIKAINANSKALGENQRALDAVHWTLKRINGNKR